MGESVTFQFNILKERGCLGDLGVDGGLMFQKLENT